MESNLELSEEDFKKLEKSDTDLEKDEEEKKDLFLTSYKNIVDILKYYLDMKEEYYNIIALWIMGTYFHDKFPSYPFLFFNAMKGSGKSRTINLITTLAKEGDILNALTEAVLFRTKGTLAIDEFEGVTRKGSENLRELLNSAYKRGAKVKRMKQMRTDKGTEMVVEEFEVYRPIVLANIWGMENVLGDRCITLILEKSDNPKIVNLVEIFRDDVIVKETQKLLNQCSLCSCCFSTEAYRAWNHYIYTYINNTNNTNNIPHTKNQEFNKITTLKQHLNYTPTFEILRSMGLNGRELELSMPLCLIATEISEEILKETTLTLKTIFLAKKEEEVIENTDISLYDFLAQQLDLSDFLGVNKLTNMFRDFLETDDPDINPKWMGRALKRLNLIIEKKRDSQGALVKINHKKAKDKIRMFR